MIKKKIKKNILRKFFEDSQRPN